MRIRRYPAVAAALALTVLACGGPSGTPTPASPAPTTSAAPATSAPPATDAPASEEPPPSEGAGSDTARVAIADSAFSPSGVEVVAGGEVVWTHRGDLPHTVTFEDEGPDSGNLAAGGTFRATFEEAGEFSYACSIHPQMQGTVTVSE